MGMDDAAIARRYGGKGIVFECVKIYAGHRHKVESAAARYRRASARNPAVGTQLR